MSAYRANNKTQLDSLIRQGRTTFFTINGIFVLLSGLLLESTISLQQGGWTLLGIVLSLSGWLLSEPERFDRHLQVKLPPPYGQRFLVFTTLLAGMNWAIFVFYRVDFSASALPLTIVLVGLNILAALTLNLTLAIAFSIPVIVGLMALLLSEPRPAHWQIDLVLSLLASLILYLGACHVRQVRLLARQPVDSKSNLTAGGTAMQMQQELERLQVELAHELAHRRKAEAALHEHQHSLDYSVQERNRELIESNELLSQQITLRKSVSDALLKSQTRLTQAIEASKLGLIDWDVAAGQFYQSAFHPLFGSRELTTEQLIRHLKQILFDSDYSVWRDAVRGCLQGEVSDYQIQYRLQGDDGHAIWIEESGRAVEHFEDGRASRILGTRRNIQSEVMRDQQVRLAKAVFDHTSEGVFVLDRSFRFISVNPAYTLISGYKFEDVEGRSILQISDTPRKEDLYEQIMAEVTRNGLWQGEILEKRSDGEYYPQWTQINAIYDEAREVNYFAGLISDLTDRKAVDEKLNYLLHYDDLTGLANRAHFKDQLLRALVRSRETGMSFAVVSLDIDRFKRFNDSFGHDQADELLEQVAQRLGAVVQQVDILARVGGNEFACIVECSPTFDVNEFAQRLTDSVSRHQYQLDNQALNLSSSVGVVRVPEDTQDLKALMKYSALALQKAKYLGGNQVVRFDESLKTFSRERLIMEQQLRQALSNRELEVYYQPKKHLDSDRITSCEALIRWAHPDKGMISPADFVHVAEECGLISELGRYVLEDACKQVRAWQEQGLGTIDVSVNLSPRQMQDSDLAAVIGEVLQRTGFNPRLLELELTESAIMEDHEGAVSLLKDLRQLGIKISVDDFGTGYSSLSYLQALPVDTLKIDQSFIFNLENSSQNKAIVKAIIVLARNLDLKVVAEGVENEAQLAFLRDNNCDLIQGYLISRPVVAGQMEAMLKKQRGPLHVVTTASPSRNL